MSLGGNASSLASVAQGISMRVAAISSMQTIVLCTAQRVKQGIRSEKQLIDRITAEHSPYS
jgi:hypothetical protein